VAIVIDKMPIKEWSICAMIMNQKLANSKICSTAQTIDLIQSLYDARGYIITCVSSGACSYGTCDFLLNLERFLYKLSKFSNIVELKSAMLLW
jgi:hypothetical protein